ncbi:hypothetical protein ACX8XP_17465 [Calditrichota bacterium LG25]
MSQRNIRLFFTTGLLLLSMFAFGFAGDRARPNWDSFGKQLVIALNTPNTGLQVSAMQRIIQYADSLDVYGARYAVMDIFLQSENAHIRRLALVTLNKINSRFDLGYLQLHYPYEKDTMIKKHIAAVLLDAGWDVPGQ